MMNENYAPYKLRDNPFPRDATVNVGSDDVRINGSIFCPEIFEKEISEIKKEMDYKTNLIYICGLQYERGVGKSAVMSHLWRELRPLNSLYTAFVDCEESGFYSRPVGFCARIIQELHKWGYLWSVFVKVLLKYAEQTGEIVKESVEILSDHYKSPPEKLPLKRYIWIYDEKRLISNIINWVSAKTHCSDDFLNIFFNIYSTCPASFHQKMSKRTFDFMRYYEDVLKLLQFCGYRYGYFFLNQFEWAVPHSAKIREFCIGMRRLLEMSKNQASIIVTLHPDAYTKLTSPLAEHLRTLAPFDNKHYKVLNVLPRDGKLAILLAKTYIEIFRSETVVDPVYPFEPLAIRYVCFLHDGNIREILQTLHRCVEAGAKQGYPKINMEFLIKKHQEILGRNFNKEKYNEFKKFVA